MASGATSVRLSLSSVPGHRAEGVALFLGMTRLADQEAKPLKRQLVTVLDGGVHHALGGHWGGTRVDQEAGEGRLWARAFM